MGGDLTSSLAPGKDTELPYPAKTPISTLSLTLWVLIDVAMYVTFCLRDYDQDYNMVVSHFVSWHFITDVVIFFVPLKYRHYATVFRLMRAYLLLQYVGWLWYANQDGEKIYTVLRLTTAGISLVHGVFMLKTYGPFSFDEIASFAWFVVKKFRHATREGASPLEQLAFNPIILGLFACLSGETFYRMHWNYDNKLIDASISSLQGGQGLPVMFKAGIFSLLIDTPGKHVVSAFLVMVGFYAQVPIMWDMFSVGPIPYVHLIGDTAFLWDFLSKVAAWRKDPRPFDQQSAPLEDSAL